MPDVKDVYRTLTQSGEAVYTEKRSRFLAFAYHVDTEVPTGRRLLQPCPIWYMI